MPGRRTGAGAPGYPRGATPPPAFLRCQRALRMPRERHSLGEAAGSGCTLGTPGRPCRCSAPWSGRRAAKRVSLREKLRLKISRLDPPQHTAGRHWQRRHLIDCHRRSREVQLGTHKTKILTLQEGAVPDIDMDRLSTSSAGQACLSNTGGGWEFPALLGRHADRSGPARRWCLRGEARRRPIRLTAAGVSSAAAILRRSATTAQTDPSATQPRENSSHED